MLAYYLTDFTMEIVQQIVFILLVGLTGWLVARRAGVISKTIRLGRDEDRTDQPEKRLAKMLRIAFGQKKMFDKPLVGFLHLADYLGFILINVEVLEIVIDGIFRTHRDFAFEETLSFPGYSLMLPGIIACHSASAMLY